MKKDKNNCADVVRKAFEQASNDHFGVMFASVVGSQNYGLATDKSDIDMKVAIYPGFASYWRNSFPKGHSIIKGTNHSYDILTVHDWFHNGVIKGNMNFFEPLYCDYIVTADLETSKLMDKMRQLLEGSVILVLQAQFHTARRYLDDFMQNRECENQIWERNEYGYNSKSAANAFRLLKFVQKFYNSGKIDITYCAPYSLEIRNGNKNEEELRKFLTEMLQETGNMLFSNFGKMNEQLLVRRELFERDKTDSHEWNVLKEEIDMTLMKNNLKLIRA